MWRTIIQEVHTIDKATMTGQTLEMPITYWFNPDILHGTAVVIPKYSEDFHIVSYMEYFQTHDCYIYGGNLWAFYLGETDNIDDGKAICQKFINDHLNTSFPDVKTGQIIDKDCHIIGPFQY